MRAVRCTPVAARREFDFVVKTDASGYAHAALCSVQPSISRPIAATQLPMTRSTT